MKRHAEAVKKKYSDNIGHINSNLEVQMIFNEEFMNFMDNKKKRKGKKPSKCSEKELKNFEELKLDESSSDNSEHKMFSSDSDSSDDDQAWKAGPVHSKTKSRTNKHYKNIN